MHLAQSKRRKIESILRDREIGPDLTPDAMDCLHGLAAAWLGIEDDAKVFVETHAKPPFPKGT